MWNRTPFSTRLAAEYLAMLAVPSVGMHEWPQLSPNRPRPSRARAERWAGLRAWENEGGTVAAVPVSMEYSAVDPRSGPTRH